MLYTFNTDSYDQVWELRMEKSAEKWGPAGGPQKAIGLHSDI